ncbi:MAG: helix-turn-helix domain-containing protein, partial [Bacteroidales bacterium]|nr:helix-turn-helix domain-containing protein [Bacteroidales bacterium]
MRTELSNKEIGNRIMTTRKTKGFSQEDLASILGISRSALAQIELGNRKVSVIELMNLSLNLGFSIDKILAKDFNFQSKVIEITKKNEE